MKKKNSFIILFLVIILVLSVFAFVINQNLSRPVKATTLSSFLSSISGGANFNEDLVSLAVGLQFDKISMQEVNAYMSNLSDPLVYLQAVAELSKLNGFEVDETKMKWALASITVMPDGLPQTEVFAGEPAFCLYDRYAFQGFYYAQLFNYSLTKWNVTEAYESFHSALFNQPIPDVLYIWQNGIVPKAVAYGPRYYDEIAESLAACLDFYQLGIGQAMNDANNLWQWCNQYLWANGHYNYALSFESSYECEAGGFYQIALRYHYLNPSANITNVYTDALNRFLVDGWSSPQWSCNGTLFYATVHDNISNNEVRLENTLSAWQSLNGLYPSFSADTKTTFDNLLSSAWNNLINHSGLYVENKGFRLQSDGPFDSDATSEGLNLLLLLGIVPITGSLAIPLNEQYYEDVFSTLDSNLYNLNLSNQTLTFSVLNAGTFNFQYGSTPVTSNFSSPGVYSVHFTSNYNNITSIQLLEPLPTNRVYMGTTSDSA